MSAQKNSVYYESMHSIYCINRVLPGHKFSNSSEKPPFGPHYREFYRLFNTLPGEIAVSRPYPALRSPPIAPALLTCSPPCCRTADTTLRHYPETRKKQSRSESLIPKRLVHDKSIATPQVHGSAVRPDSTKGLAPLQYCDGWLWRGSQRHQADHRRDR